MNNLFLGSALSFDLKIRKSQCNLNIACNHENFQVSKPAILTGIAARKMLVNQKSEILKTPATKSTSIAKPTGAEPVRNC